jgi:hypothetical protein
MGKPDEGIENLLVHRPRLPWGIGLAARGEYRGGNVRSVSPVPVSRGVVSALCMPYYVDPSTSLTLRADTPDLWRERCTPTAGHDYWFDGDFFKLRSVALAVPVSFVFPERVDEATLKSRSRTPSRGTVRSRGGT